MTHSGPLSGAHAVVTGGGRGIGAAIAARLSQDGARVTVMGRQMPPLRTVAADLGEGQAIVLDVTRSDQLADAFDQAAAAFGPVSILVNNAGAAESAPFTRLNADHWQRMLDVNLTAAYGCIRTVIKPMLDAGTGRIVNIASTAGLKGYPYVAAYCAAKHGLVGLTRALAVELAETGITVNAVCPGFTDTDIVANSLETLVKKTGRSHEQALSDLIRGNPQKRLIQPAEVANTVAWLCRPDSAAITGQSIAVAGGEIM